MDTSGLMFPKIPRKKKKKRKRESIMHRNDGTCYICRLNGDWTRKWPPPECHHVIGGNAGRPLSTEYGLLVWLCREHHTGSKNSVHHNKKMMDDLRIRARRAFEKEYPELDFIEIFGKGCIAKDE